MGRDDVDDIDRHILEVLQGNARLPVSQVAKRIGLTDNAVRQRIRRMRERGLIRGFVMLLDPHLQGRPLLAIATARVRDREEPEATMARLLAAHPEILGAYEGVGDHDLCLLVAARDEPDWTRVLAQLRTHPSLDHVRGMLVTEGHGASPMPLLPPLPGVEPLNEVPLPAAAKRAAP